MRAQRVLFAAAVLSFAVVLAGCGNGSSKKRSFPRLQTASFLDGGVAGTIDLGDTITITFSKAVSLAGNPTAASIFTLPVSGDTFGTSTTAPGASPDQLVIVLDSSASFTPDGSFAASQTGAGSPSGLGILATQSALTFGNKGKPVPVTGPVDIGGTLVVPPPGGTWTTVPGTMSVPRFAHSATLLANGEVLIVGGLSDASSPVSPGFRQSLTSIEIFDPATGSFTLRGSLVRARGYHRAILTPGPDSIIETNDDYVVIVGGWNTERSVNNGPGAEASLEVIHPDPNGDGNTSDLVVNPGPGGAPLGAVLDDLGTLQIGGITSACDPATPGNVSVGMMNFEMTWLPGGQFGGPGSSNEVISVGNWITWVWDDCANGLLFFNIWFNPDPVVCQDGRILAIVDPNSDGDTSDSTLGNNLSFPGGPWTTPVSLVRQDYIQVRLPGADMLDGTVDDFHMVYGGLSYDTLADCNGTPTPLTLSADLETFDLLTGSNFTGVASAFQAGGATCAAPGTGTTDRWGLQGVATGNATNDVVIANGNHTAFPNAPFCQQALESIRPNFASPGASTVGFVASETLTHRVWNHRIGLLPGTGAVLLTGGSDTGGNDIPTGGATTASTEYIQLPAGAVTSMPDMSEARELHGLVTLPAGAAGNANDRVYVFGGIDRPTQAFLMVLGTGATEPGTTSASAEYFEE